MNFERCIQGDCAIVICKFLDPKDILTLYQMYPKILPKITLIFKKRVGEVIDEFFRYSFNSLSDYKEFRQAMIDSNATLSGSFILQAILNERWFKKHKRDKEYKILSDVDIFVFVDKIKIPKKSINWKQPEGVTFLYKNHALGYTSLHNFLFKAQTRSEMILKRQEKYFRKFGIHNRTLDEHNFVTQSFYMDDFGTDVILRINEYKVKKYVFEVVEIDRELYNTFEEFMEQTVDFDICKNFFRYIDSNDKFEIHIENLSNIINKRMHILKKTNSVQKSQNQRDKSSERLKKYTERGFVYL